MSLKKILRLSKPKQTSNAHLGQANSVERKRARQQANLAALHKKAKKIGLTVVQMRARCAVEVADYIKDSLKHQAAFEARNPHRVNRYSGYY